MSDLIKTLKSSSTGDDVYPNIKEDNIPTGAVTSAKIGTSAVTTGKINDGAVTTNKIADGSVNYDKLATALKNLIDGKASSSDLIIVQNALSSHTSNTSNPHSVTKSQVGLGNVDNTSDANKPISTATQTALDLKADKSTTYTKTEVDTALNGKQDTLTFDNTPTQDSTNPVKSGGVYTSLSDKQDILVSGTNIKTINNETILGSGNINISGGGSQLYLHSIKIDADDPDSEACSFIINLISDTSGQLTSLSGINVNKNKIVSVVGTSDSEYTSKYIIVGLSGISVGDTEITLYYFKLSGSSIVSDEGTFSNISNIRDSVTAL